MIAHNVVKCKNKKHVKNRLVLVIIIITSQIRLACPARSECSSLHSQSGTLAAVLGLKGSHTDRVLLIYTPCLEKKEATLFSTITLVSLGGFL